MLLATCVIVLKRFPLLLTPGYGVAHTWAYESYPENESGNAAGKRNTPYSAREAARKLPPLIQKTPEEPVEARRTGS